MATRTWQLQQAKARLSELIRRARTEGPQTITVRGAEEAVVISADEYSRLARPPQRTLVDALLNPPDLGLSDEEVDELFSRSPDTGREVDLGDLDLGN